MLSSRSPLNLCYAEDDTMRFPLRYEGPLLSSSDKHTRVANKNQIRWCLSPQLITLEAEADFSRLPEPTTERKPKKLGKFRFLPIITKSRPVICGLTIRIERRERPGGLLTHEGDLDNRLKTLLDALRVPDNENEIRPNTNEPNLTTASAYYKTIHR
jgi:hypothetical protein